MPHDIDVHVGNMIRQRRWLIGLTQEALAEKIDVKFQQVQKYETGVNRVSASRLWMIAQALGVQISYFFEDLGETAPEDTEATKDASKIFQTVVTLPRVHRQAVMATAQAFAGAA